MKDTFTSIPDPAEWMWLTLPGGMWVEMPDTWANRRSLMIVLRCLRTAEGRPRVSFEQLAEKRGYADRRNVHNYWMEFESCGGDLEAYLARRKKVDAEVVARCEQLWQAHPLWSAAQVYEEYKQRWPEQGAGLSEANIRTAGPQSSFLKLQQILRRQLQEGSVSYPEEVLVEQLFELAAVGAQTQANEAGSVAPLPEELERVSPQGTAPDLSDGPPRHLVEEIETSLLGGIHRPRRWRGCGKGRRVG